VPHDLRHGAPILPKRADLIDSLGGELRLGAEPRPPFFSLGYPVHLSLPPNVVLELGDQREDAHNELAGAGGRVECKQLKAYRSGLCTDLLGYEIPWPTICNQ
jgi:hypothetical protein